MPDRAQAGAAVHRLAVVVAVRSSASPVWSADPDLDRRGVGQGSAATARWIATAAVDGVGGRAKTAKRLSPSPRGRMWTPHAVLSDRLEQHVVRGAAPPARPSGAASQSAVLPSTSVRRNVTVPAGIERARDPG